MRMALSCIGKEVTPISQSCLQQHIPTKWNIWKNNLECNSNENLNIYSASHIENKAYHIPHPPKRNQHGQ
jgi:hypothetical protein